MTVLTNQKLVIHSIMTIMTNHFAGMVTSAVSRWWWWSYLLARLPRTCLPSKSSRSHTTPLFTRVETLELMWQR